MLGEQARACSTSPLASRIHIIYSIIKMARHVDSRCVLISDPSTLGAGTKTRLESAYY